MREASLWGIIWHAHGHLGEGRRWLEEDLAKDDRASVTVRIKALEALFWLMFEQWDHDLAEGVAQEAMELSAEVEIGSSLAASLRLILVGPAWNRGDYERGKEIYEEGIAVCRQVGYTYRLPNFLSLLGYMLLLEGDYERGAALNEEAAALCRERGYKRNLFYALDNLGWAALLQGDHDRARVFYEESLTLCKALGNKMIASGALEGMACLSSAKGEALKAARLFGAAQALRVRESVALQHTPEQDAYREPYLAPARSQLGEAAWQAAWAEGRAMSMDGAIKYALSEEEPSAMPPSSGQSSLSSMPEHPSGPHTSRGGGAGACG